jgi:hypothetical protein
MALNLTKEQLATQFVETKFASQDDFVAKLDEFCKATHALFKRT